VQLLGAPRGLLPVGHRQLAAGVVQFQREVELLPLLQAGLDAHGHLLAEACMPQAVVAVDKAVVLVHDDGHLDAVTVD
jgi:hypothetical protein